MIGRIINRIHVLIHYIVYYRLYRMKKTVLYGVPRIIYPNRICLGNNIRINGRVFLHAKNHIKIGNNTTLSYGATLLTESYDLSEYKTYYSRKHISQGGTISIGNNVWICANSIILPGITIADNIVVGAGSVVTHDLLDENCLYAGNPAKKIKKLW